MPKLTLGDVHAGHSWEGTGGDKLHPHIMRGHVYCRGERCHNKFVFDVEHPLPIHQYHYPRDPEYDAAREIAEAEYDKQPVPEGWIVIYAEDPYGYSTGFQAKLYCSARCARLAMNKLEKKGPLGD